MSMDRGHSLFDSISRDNVDLHKEGFVMVTRGRGGNIYFVEHQAVVVIGIEMPGVADLDVLVYGELQYIVNRYDPIRRTAEQLTIEERKRIQKLLIEWLALKGLRHDIHTAAE
ncbi:hypothetical protein [Paenibacillus sacheonensis]|uniref:Uncharacterized protein n=1 Tax=Paenibacillus sacheonensis TaxID=742054 RepID=A0A7X4YND1_9BACL|nr:hypothetical protein [Paenibacillus sacheonensis]MBM7565519.1 hypothetical protein [Paenibacillus sacheonensis]NBC69560.1 hypothetical protein [Paenibacillus sacheonensis]